MSSGVTTRYAVHGILQLNLQHRYGMHAPSENHAAYMWVNCLSEMSLSS